MGGAVEVERSRIEVRGFPPMRQKKGAWMGHGAVSGKLKLGLIDYIEIVSGRLR